MNRILTIERNRELRALAIKFAEAYPFLAEPKEAKGLCFWAAITFASFAESQGYQVEAIRWQVYNDGPYCDHWAVILEGNRVIDHTRAQVDGQTGLFWHTTSYPRGYYCRRCYPASLFLKKYRCLTLHGKTKFPESFLLDVQLAMNQFDAAHTRPTPKAQFWGMVVAAVAFYAFCAWRLFA